VHLITKLRDQNHFEKALMTEDSLIQACKKADPAAQKQLYDTYGPRLFGLVRRYMKRYEEAEDVFIEGMFKIMTSIKQFEGKGSFEGWMKRIMVNQALMQLRKNKNFRMTIELSNIQLATKITVEDTLAKDEIIKAMNELPTGYRTVFNLYVIEGYKHREIAEMLGISINTSKSQLILAKKRLGEIIKKKHRKVI